MPNKEKNKSLRRSANASNETKHPLRFTSNPSDENQGGGTTSTSESASDSESDLTPSAKSQPKKQRAKLNFDELSASSDNKSWHSANYSQDRTPLSSISEPGKPEIPSKTKEAIISEIDKYILSRATAQKNGKLLLSVISRLFRNKKLTIDKIKNAKQLKQDLSVETDIDRMIKRIIEAKKQDLVIEQKYLKKYSLFAKSGAKKCLDNIEQIALSSEISIKQQK